MVVTWKASLFPYSGNFYIEEEVSMVAMGTGGVVRERFLKETSLNRLSAS
jgi:hypothetical protein